MSLLALTLSILAVAASLAVAVLAWHAMSRLEEDLRTHASIAFMRLDSPSAAHPRPAQAGRSNDPS